MLIDNHGRRIISKYIEGVDDDFKELKLIIRKINIMRVDKNYASNPKMPEALEPLYIGPIYFYYGLQGNNKFIIVDKNQKYSKIFLISEITEYIKDQ